MPVNQHPLFFKIKVDCQRTGKHVRPVHYFPNNQLLWKRTDFPFLILQVAIRVRVMVLWRSACKMALLLQKNAAKTPICSPNTNSQPKR